MQTHKQTSVSVSISDQNAKQVFTGNDIHDDNLEAAEVDNDGLPEEIDLEDLDAVIDRDR